MFVSTYQIVKLENLTPLFHYITYLYYERTTTGTCADWSSRTATTVPVNSVIITHYIHSKTRLPFGAGARVVLMLARSVSATEDLYITSHIRDAE